MSNMTKTKVFANEELKKMVADYTQIITIEQSQTVFTDMQKFQVELIQFIEQALKDARVDENEWWRNRYNFDGVKDHLELKSLHSKRIKELKDEKH